MRAAQSQTTKKTKTQSLKRHRKFIKENKIQKTKHIKQQQIETYHTTEGQAHSKWGG